MVLMVAMNPTSAAPKDPLRKVPHHATSDGSGQQRSGRDSQEAPRVIRAATIALGQPS
jgi:hypothetical protein